MSACPFRIGDIVKTSYDTGPYEIVKISGPCRCAPFGWVINHMSEEDPEDWEEHWHLECTWAGPRAPGHAYTEHYYLNGYGVHDTEIVQVPQKESDCGWGQREKLYIIKRGPQLELF